MPAKRKTINPGSRVLVVGLGKSGLAAARFLHQQGIRVSISEAAAADRISPEARQWLAGKDLPLETGGHSVEMFCAADLILVSPGVALDLEPLAAARRRAIPIVGEMAVAAQYIKTPVIAITGTNGKTTVTTLLGEIFAACGRKAFVGGNIGTPLFTYLSGKQDAEAAIIEVSSFQLDTAGGFRPDIAILLNISPDHLDRYESFAAYSSSKFSIFSAQGHENIAIMNADDQEIINNEYAWPASRKFFFGENMSGRKGAIIDGKRIVLSGCFHSSDPKKNEDYDLSKTPLNEPPNLQNSAAAILAARLIDCPPAGIIKALHSFSLLPHRMNLVGEINGVRYYDDSKATNIGAVQSALAGSDRPVILIAGGRDKGGDYALLNDLVAKKVKALVLIGEAADLMARAFAALTRVERAASMQEAVHKAHRAAAPGDIVLLSPACASFDMFDSYAHRGRIFREALRSLEQKRTDRDGITGLSSPDGMSI